MGEPILQPSQQVLRPSGRLGPDARPDHHVVEELLVHDPLANQGKIGLLPGVFIALQPARDPSQQRDEAGPGGEKLPREPLCHEDREHQGPQDAKDEQESLRDRLSAFDRYVSRWLWRNRDLPVTAQEEAALTLQLQAPLGPFQPGGVPPAPHEQLKPPPLLPAQPQHRRQQAIDGIALQEPPLCSKGQVRWFFQLERDVVPMSRRIVGRAQGVPLEPLQPGAWPGILQLARHGLNRGLRASDQHRPSAAGGEIFKGDRDGQRGDKLLGTIEVRVVERREPNLSDSDFLGRFCPLIEPFSRCRPCQPWAIGDLEGRSAVAAGHPVV